MFEILLLLIILRFLDQRAKELNPPACRPAANGGYMGSERSIFTLYTLYTISLHNIWRNNGRIEFAHNYEENVFRYQFVDMPILFISISPKLLQISRALFAEITSS